MTPPYPRTCSDCSFTYAHKSSFSRHLSSGQCLRRQSTSNKLPIGGVNIVYNVQQINTINNYNLPDWMSEQNYSGQTIQKLAKTIEALEEKQGIKGKNDTDFYIRKEVYGYSDYKDALEKNSGNLNTLIDDIINQTQRLSGINAKIEPIRLLYRLIFQTSRTIINIQDLQRRPFMLQDRSHMVCEVLDYDKKLTKDTGNPCILGWQSVHWQNLLIDLLLTLGNKIYKRMKPKQEDDEEDMKVVFQQWWQSINSSSDLLLGDKLIKKLMREISSELMKECKNDMMVGWHKLIEHCNILHKIGSIEKESEEDQDNPFDPKITELERKRDIIESDLEELEEEADETTEAEIASLKTRHEAVKIELKAAYRARSQWKKDHEPIRYEDPPSREEKIKSVLSL